MRCLAALLAGCSFVAVHAPPANVEAGKPVDCTDSDTVPSIDSLTGVLLIAGSIGGEVDHELYPGGRLGKIDNYELLVALPMLAAGIVYLVSASHGTDRIEQCKQVKEGDTTGCDGCSERVP